MKLKLLLSTGLLLVGTHLAKAQATYGTWVGQSNATPFEYNIAAGTLGATFTSTNADQASLSTSPNSAYLAFPSSGSARAFTSANGGGAFTIDGSTLSFTASNSGVNKFSLYGVNGTSAVTSIFFKLKIDGPASSGTVMIGFGKTGVAVPAEDIFSNGKQLTVGDTNPRFPDLFGAFRSQPGGSQANTGAYFFRTSDNTYRFSDPGLGNSYAAFKKNLSQNIEIYCNNTTVPRSYSRGVDNNYTLPPRTYNVFVDGVRLEVASNTPTVGIFPLTYNIPASAEFAAGEKLDAIFVGGNGSGSNNLVISISDIKFGWIPQNVLPVELSSFTGKKTSSGAELNWATASEKNNSHFEILRASQDGVFKAIDKVNGKGNSDANSNYQFTDNNPLTGKNYYKLKQVGVNGNSKEYGPVVVTFDLETNKLTTYLNADQQLLLTYKSLENTQADLVIADLSGKKLIVQKVALSKGVNQPKVDVSVLPKGLYVVKIGAKGNVGAAKFVK